MPPEIVALGEPMLEFNAAEEGTLAEARGFLVGWGGDTSNFVVAAARLGGRAGYFTRLGDDEFAESFLKLWRDEGVDASRVVKDPKAFTGIYFISRKGGDHYFTYFRRGSAASLMTPDDLPADYIRGARLLHVSGISQAISLSACDTVFTAVALAREAGVLVCYDPNLRLKLWPLSRARAIIHQTAAQADLVLPSLEDARQLTGLEAPEDLGRFYLDLGPRIVVVKLGAEGALLATPAGIERFPGFKVQAIDTSGAGDAFDAAFAVGHLAGWPLERCVRFANAAGALTSTGLGVVGAIPRRPQVEALLAQEV
ncbi:MAG: sugar kinase [Thermodesulfobacteriota bacterium]